MPKIKDIDYGIGFVLCDGRKRIHIELNKNLKKYPKLRKFVLAHEMQHWNSKSEWEDFKIDFYDCLNLRKGLSILKFNIMHPKSSLGMSPVFFQDGKAIPNYFMVGFWGIVSITLITLGTLL